MCVCRQRSVCRPLCVYIQYNCSGAEIERGNEKHWKVIKLAACSDYMHVCANLFKCVRARNRHDVDKRDRKRGHILTTL